MISKFIFIDSSWFKAFSDPKDDFHTKAIGQYHDIVDSKSELITTNFVIDETYTLIRSKVGFQSSLDFRDMLGSMGDILKVVRINQADESSSWNWFVKPWSHLSFTDCTSFAVMKRLELTDVATFDHHFAQAGFKLLK